MNIFKSCKNVGCVVAMMSLMATSHGLHAAIAKGAGASVDLYAKQWTMSTPDGDSLKMWSFSNGEGGDAVYPAPTIIVNQGETVNITVHNVDVPQPVSLVFPGQGQINRDCDIGNPNTLSFTGCYGSGDELLNVVAADNGVNSITYKFIASKPGTYMYHSGVSPQIQSDMGLVGAMIVRPTTIPAGSYPDPTNVDNAGAQLGGAAYNDAASYYDQEYLFFFSEMDPKLHYLAEHSGLDQWDNADYRSVLFLINGRMLPDTLAPDNYPYLKNQPLGSLVIMKPGQRILLRVLNIGRVQHPLHLHGNHYNHIAIDGNMLKTTNRNGVTGFEDYTLDAVPGSTTDVIFTWSGKEMGWDIFNPDAPTPGIVGSTKHSDEICTDDENNRTGAPGSDGHHDITWEWCADHNNPIPIVFPENQDLGFGGFYGGSPYLGDVGNLPVGEGGLNPWGGMVFMWHSHSERDLTNNDIFPGGMITLSIIVPR